MSKEENDCQEIIKVILLGEISVGKTCLINAYFGKKFIDVFNGYNKMMTKEHRVKRGLDGRWRFEFSDKDSKVDNKYVGDTFFNKIKKLKDKSFEVKISDILTHDELYKHYPNISKYKLVFATSSYPGLDKNTEGYHDSIKQKIAINIDTLENKSVKDRENALRETLLHEIQHYIQDYEGFASGNGSTKLEKGLRVTRMTDSYINKLGGKKEAGNQLLKAVQNVIKNINKVPKEKRGELYNKIYENSTYFNFGHKQYILQHPQAIIRGYLLGYQDENRKFKNYYDNKTKEICEYLSLSKDLGLNEELLKPLRQYSKIYWDTLGEIEARQTEQRKNMTMEMRNKKTDVLDETYRNMKTHKDSPVLISHTKEGPITERAGQNNSRFQTAKQKKKEKVQQEIKEAKEQGLVSDSYVDTYSVSFTKSAQEYEGNRKKMEDFDKKSNIWSRNEENGKVTYTRKIPYDHHKQTITYNGINDVVKKEREKSVPQKWLEWAKDQAIKYMFNDKHYLAKAARKLHVYDAYKRMVVVEGYTMKANTALTQGIKYGNKTARALNDIIREIGSEKQKNFIEYCIAHRILSFKEHRPEIEQKMKLNDAQNIINRVKNSSDAELFEKNRKDFVEYNKALLHVLVDGGILSEERFNKFCEEDPEFVPLAKVMEEADFGFNSIIAAHNYVNVKSPIKKIGTSFLEVKNPFLEMQKRTAEYYAIASRNKAGQIFVNEIANHLDVAVDGTTTAKGSGLIRRVKVNEKNGKLITKPDDRQQIFYVCNNGKHEFYQVADREIYHALKCLNADQMSTIEKMLGGIARFNTKMVREGATMVPDFGIRNFFRDQGEAFLTSEHGYIPFVDAAWGIYQIINNTEWAKAYFEQNGEFGTLVRDDVNGNGVVTTQDIVESKLNPFKNISTLGKQNWNALKDTKRAWVDITNIKQGKYQDAYDNTVNGKIPALLKFVASPLWGIGKSNARFNELLELGTRVGEFKNAKMGYEGTIGRFTGKTAGFETNINKAKQSDIYAAYASKEITLNFAQHGELGKRLNKYIPFFNATLQGIYKLLNTFGTMATGETLSGEKNRNIQKELMFKCALITAMAIGVAAAGAGDEDYEEAPDYEKSNFCMLPNGLRIAKDQIFGRVIGTSVEKAYAQWKRGKAEPSEILKNIIDEFTPNLIPALADVFVGGIANYDTFRNRTIIPEYMTRKNLPGRLQKDLSTSNLAVDISEGLWKTLGWDVSAKKLDWAIQKNLSNCAKYAQAVYDLGTGQYNEKMTRGYDKNDFTGAFVGGLKDDVPPVLNLISGTFATNRTSFKSVSDFYERHRELQGLSHDEESMTKEEKHAWKLYEQAYKKDATYRKQLKAIKSDRSLTGAQKRERADKIFKQQIEISNKLKDWERKHGLL